MSVTLKNQINQKVNLKANYFRKTKGAEQRRDNCLTPIISPDDNDPVENLPRGQVHSNDDEKTNGMEFGSECGFLKISNFLERILMEHIGMKNRLDSKLQIFFLFH